ncbi:SET_domain_containing_protein (plasmid) [Leishmania braziliensis MHOM/BR/75/M2904]|nr:SET_domain_containing_protein [Leishmania braziliensis MHOM/BR/75/M2904]
MMIGGTSPDGGDVSTLVNRHHGSPGLSDGSSTSLPPQVKWVDTATGVGVFATRAYQAGSRVLWETPWVFAQSYKTWNTCPAGTQSHADKSVSAENTSKTVGEEAGDIYSAVQRDLPAMHSSSWRQPGHWAPSVSTDDVEQGSRNKCVPETGTSTEEKLQCLRCCFGCGTPLLAFLREECDRLDGVLQELDGSSDVRLDSISPGNTNNDMTPLTQTPDPSMWQLICDANVQHLAQAPGEAPTDVSLPAPPVKKTSESAAAAASPRSYLTEVDVAGRRHCVYFCTPACEKHSLTEEGKRFVLTSLQHGHPPVSDAALDRAEDWMASAAAATASPSPLSAHAPWVLMLRYPTADDIVHFAQHPPSVALRLSAWPTRLYALSSLHSIARRCNERVWLLTLLLAKHLRFTLASTSVSSTSLPQPQSFVAWLGDTVAPAFRTRLEDMLRCYAEGAMQLLSTEQRSLLRFSWHLLTWWWLLSCAEEYTTIAITATGARGTDSTGLSLLYPLYPALERRSPPSTGTTSEKQVLEWVTDALAVAQCTAFPLQLYLQLYWLTNANVHMYVITSPLYTLWCRWLQSKAERSDAAGTDALKVASREDGTTAQVANSVMLLERLYTLFHGVNAGRAEAAVGAKGARGPGGGISLHAAGVALYDVATKLNHSCAPNVRFQPTMGPVAASVVALRAIEAGEQLFTSYICVEDFGEQACAAAARRRRRYLKDYYGFECRCPVCELADTVRERDET